MANNFFKVKNGLNLSTLNADPTLSPPANSATGDMAFYGGKLYKYNGSAWVVSPGSGTTGLIINTDVDATAAIEGTKINPNFGAQLVKTTSKLEVLSNTPVEAVLINQIGTGNALVVEDNTNPDATATIIDASGNVGIGVAANIALTEKLKVVGNVKVDSTGAMTIPVGADGGRPVTPEQGMIRYNTTQSTFEGYNGATWSGLGGSGTTNRITQANSFNVGDVVYLNGSTYTAAIATAANTAEVVGVVSKIITAGTVFEITLVGEVSGLVAASFDEGTLPAVGEVVFLSPTNAGKLVVTDPSVAGQVSVPVGIVSSSIAGPAVTLYVQPKRGVVVGGANLRTQIRLNGSGSINQTTNIQNVTAYTAGELSGWVYIDAAIDRRFYIQVQFVKDGDNAWKCAYQTTGDTPPADFNVDVVVVGADAFVQVQMPPVAGFNPNTSIINFALNAPAVGATLPLQVDSANVNFTNIQAATAAGITFKENDGTTTGSVSDAGAWTLGPSSSANTQLINGTVIVRTLSTTGGLRVDQSVNTTLVRLLGAEGGMNGFLKIFTHRSDLSNEILAGEIVSDGAWKLGPSTGASRTHVLNMGDGTSDALVQVNTSAATAVGVDTNVSVRINGANQAQIGSYRNAGTGANGAGYLFVRNGNGTDYVYYVGNDSNFRQSTSKNDVGLTAGTIVGTQTSDARLKTDIETLGTGLSSIMALRPVSFKFNHTPDRTRLGFIAQEAELVIPSSVYEGGLFAEDNSRYKNMEYTEIIAPMVKAIQEQQAQIEELKAKLAALEAK